MSRLHFAYVLIGTARTGKTTKVLAFAQEYKRRFPKRKVIFVSLQPTEINRWSGIHTESHPNPNRFKADKVIHEQTLKQILKKRSENRKQEYLFDPLLLAGPSLIILDDMKYYTSKEGLEVTRLLVKRGHYDADVLLVYHSFLEVHPKVFGYAYEFWLMRINESPEACIKRANNGIFTEETLRQANQLKTGEVIRIVQIPS